MAQQVQFIYLTQAQYDALDPKLANRLYFTTDTRRIYRGSVLYSDAGTPIAFDNTPAQHPVDTDGVVSEGVVLSSGVFKGDASKADKAALCRDVYDFSQNSEIVRALTNCVSSLGGTVVNSPLYNGENWWGLHFIADTARTKIKLIRTGNPPTVQLKYSLDWGSTWNTYTMGTDITLTNAGDGVCFAAADDVTNESFTNNADNYTKFVITGSAGAYGDISSLIKDDEDAWLLPLGTRQYQQLFQNCTGLTHCPDLPAVFLNNLNCYLRMFEGCTSITTTPKMPLTTIGRYAYTFMFQNCTSLRRIEVPWSAWRTPYNAYYSWVNGVSGSGLFVCPSSLGSNDSITRDIDHCPVGWTVVNNGISYIESNCDGFANGLGAYFDSGVVAKPGTKCLAMFRWTKSETADNVLLGAYNNSATNTRFVMLCTNANMHKQLGAGAGWVKSGTYSANVDYVQESVFASDQESARVINDGPTTQTVSTGADATLVSWQGNNATENIGKTLFIFANNNVLDSTTNTPIASNFCSARLYWMKIWQDNVLVRDYIPVVSNGEAGLYDKVNKTTIFNAGPSGTSFTYG